MNLKIPKGGNDGGLDCSSAGANTKSLNRSHNDNDCRGITHTCPSRNPNNNDDNRPHDLAQMFAPSLFLTLSAIVLVANQICDRPETASDEYSHHYNTSEYHVRSLGPDIGGTHKRLWPLSTEDWVGFACATLGLMIAGGGGIGGGGMLVPIYILVMKFSPKHAIPLANVTVLGGAVANTVLNSTKRHPLANRPLVDWDLILAMEPLTIGGALVGAFLNKLLSDELLVVLLVLLLSFTAKTTLQKAWSMYQKESQDMLKNERRDNTVSDISLIKARQYEDGIVGKETDALLDHKGLEDEEETNVDSTSELSDEDSIDKRSSENNGILQKILDEESRTPMGNVLVLLVTFMVVLFINLAKGGGAFPSPVGIECGSYAFWAANVTMLVWVIMVSLLVRSYLVKRCELKRKISYPYVEGDIQWDSWTTIQYPAICCLAGFFAGMFGVGGGIVKGPLMLSVMGVHPMVSSACSACMILFTSFSATASFVVFGLLIKDYAPVCFGIGFVATVLGQLGLSYLMRKFNRNSFIAFSIGGVVLLSAFLMTVQSLISIAEGTHHRSGGLCGDAAW